MIGRVLKGSRKWRRDIPFGAFMHEAMRSVVGVEKRHPERRPVSFDDWMEVGDDADRDCENEFACTPEAMLIKQQEGERRRKVLDVAKSRLSHDKVSLDIFSGLAQEMTPAEIRKAYGISERGYKAARARIAKEVSSKASGTRR